MRPDRPRDTKPNCCCCCCPPTSCNRGGRRRRRRRRRWRRRLCCRSTMALVAAVPPESSLPDSPDADAEPASLSVSLRNRRGAERAPPDSLPASSVRSRTRVAPLPLPRLCLRPRPRCLSPGSSRLGALYVCSRGPCVCVSSAAWPKPCVFTPMERLRGRETSVVGVSHGGWHVTTWHTTTHACVTVDLP